MKTEQQQAATPPSERWLTLPNLLTLSRLLGSPWLAACAYYHQVTALLILACLLVLTEWLDGILARWLHAESKLGARLDSIADATFYLSLLWALFVLQPDVIRREGLWIGVAIVSYWANWIASLAKFGRLPSYHTLAAKGTWLVVGPGMIMLVLGWNAWLFRFAMICVVITNLEAIAITTVLSACVVDVPTLWHAMRQERFPS